MNHVQAWLTLISWLLGTAAVYNSGGTGGGGCFGGVHSVKTLPACVVSR